MPSPAACALLSQSAKGGRSAAAADVSATPRARRAPKIARSPVPCRCAAEAPPCDEWRKQRRQLGVDLLPEPEAERIVRRCDRVAPRLDVAGEDRARDVAKIDAEVLDSGSVGNRKIGGHADQDFVQRQARGSERHQLAQGHAGQILQLGGSRDVGKNVLRTEDRAEMPQMLRDLRFDPGMPRAEKLDGGRGGVRRQRLSKGKMPQCRRATRQTPAAGVRRASDAPSAHLPARPARWRWRWRRVPAG